jgi:CelD/BcsL family acetyltransferase involved in cellulose biosynthesis
MNKNPKKSSEDASGTEEILPKIMTKPLPVILDELEDYIKRVEEAVRMAQGAARDSRAAADQARESGEKAAEAARKAADAAVAKVKDEAARRANALDDRISEVAGNLDNLEDRVKQEAIALDDAFITLKERHVEQSPFFKS